ncbi:MAG: hypothetical protein ACT6RA_09805, partial [Flavobacterium sp.]
MTQFNKFTLLGAVCAALVSCNEDDSNSKSVNKDIDFSNHSSVPAFVFPMPGFEDMEISSLISSSDVLSQSPSFVFAGQPDGAGFMKDPNSDGYIMINNHEISQSVSRVFLDKTFKPVKGEYIVNSLGGMTRLCSATLATPGIHGFGPVFLTAGESGE